MFYHKSNTASLSSMTRLHRIIIICSLIFALGGCATFDGMFDTITFGVGGDDKITGQESATLLIVKGMEAYNEGDYYDALRAFNHILDNYPFSPEAMLAQLKAADSHFYRGEYIEAKVLYLEFEERYPANEAIPYVMFQIGRSDFRMIDRIDRDTSGAEESIRSFSRLLRVFPDSPYTREAKSYIESARNFLVNHEYLVAVFHVRTKQYNQAKHRLQYLLKLYPDSTIAPKARELLKLLEAGEPPEWGIRRWLPNLSLTSLKFWNDEEEEKEQPVPPAQYDSIMPDRNYLGTRTK